MQSQNLQLSDKNVTSQFGKIQQAAITIANKNGHDQHCLSISKQIIYKNPQQADHLSQFL